MKSRNSGQQLKLTWVRKNDLWLQLWKSNCCEKNDMLSREHL